MKTYRIFALVLIFFAGFILSFGGAVFAEGPAVGPLTLVSGPSPFEQGCGGGSPFGFINYYNYKVEPYIAVNPVDPSNIVVSWMQDEWNWGGANGMVAAATHDGGRTWKRTVIPGLTQCSGGTAQRAADPWLTFAPNGDLYRSTVVSNADFTNATVLVNKSTDGGDTWSGPVVVHTNTSPNSIDDKEMIAADPFDSRYLYVTWHETQFASGTQPTMNAQHSHAIRMPLWFTRSTDSGATWEQARKIFDPGEHNSTTGPQIVVLPNGDLLNVFTLMADQQTAKAQTDIAVMRSTDKGASWSKPAIIGSLTPVYVNDPTTGEWLFTGSELPDIAVDKRNGDVYIVWEDGRFSGYAIEGIAFIKSTDGGLTWSAPAQVNKDAYAPAFTPSVAVADNGTIAVTYYDLRNDTSDPTVLQTDHWVVVSHDGGQTWTEAHVAGPFDMRSAPARGAAWYFIGDYMGLTSSGNSFVAAFTMANDGVLSNPTDIFVSTITP